MYLILKQYFFKLYKEFLTQLELERLFDSIMNHKISIAMKTRSQWENNTKPKIRTVYPDVKLSFNEISMHIRNELMKDYQQIQK